MKRGLLLLGGLLLVFSAVGAQDKPDVGFEVDASVQVNASLISGLASLDLSGVYSFGSPAVGAGVKLYAPFGYSGFLFAPYVRGEVGWFYLGAGALFLTVQPASDDPDWARVDEDVVFLGIIGAQAELAELGPGALGLDLGMDISVTPSPILESEDGNPVGTIFGTIFGAALNIFKLNLGVYYSLEL